MNFIFSWGPVALWAGLIYYLSSIPGLSTGWGVYDLILRKGAHVFEFMVLTLLIVRAAGRTWPFRSVTWVRTLAAVAAVLYAASDEIHQRFVPRRGPSVRDVLIDSVGVAIALFLLRWYQRVRGDKPA